MSANVKLGADTGVGCIDAGDNNPLPYVALTICVAGVMLFWVLSRLAEVAALLTSG